MFEETMKMLTVNDRSKLIMALNQEVSCIVIVGNSFVGVNTVAPQGYHVTEIKGNWICGDKCENN